MIYSLSSLSSYDDALASALQGQTAALATQPTSIAPHSALSAVGSIAKPTDASSDAVAAPAATVATSAAVSSTFVSSVDVLRRPRRVSPLAPARGKAAPVVGPVDAATRLPFSVAKLTGSGTTTMTTTTTGFAHLDTSTGSSVNSAISSVSDVGSALASNAAGALPYLSAPRHATIDVVHGGAAAPALTATHSPIATEPEPRAQSEVSVNNDTTLAPAHKGETSSVALIGAVASGGRTGSVENAARTRRDEALRVVSRWFRLLRWRGKWLSPFAVTLRGQIREGQQMLKDVGGGGISPVSLATQIGVWQSQLLTYMETEPAPGSIKYILRRRAAGVGDSGGAGTGEGAASRSLSPPQGDSRKRPIRMLRRGDGLARRCASAGSSHGTVASSRGFSQTPTESAPGERLPDAAVASSASAVAAADIHESKRSASPRQPGSSTTGSASGIAAKVPVVTSASRQSAAHIAQFLETIIGVGEGRSRGSGAPRSPLARVTVDAATLHRRRLQLLETLFQSPDLSSSPNTSRLPSGQPSVVPRLDIHKHREVFCAPGDCEYGAASVFAKFWHKPQLMQRYIEEYLEDEPVRGVY